MTESFWSIPDNVDIRTPLAILREQANALTQQTGGALQGQVSTLALDADIYISMQIYVPALNGYKVEILEYEQPVHMYPGTLKLNLLKNSGRSVINDEDHFVRMIKNYLSSQEMIRVVKSLLAQTKQA
jgi:hypothetical protein